MGEMLDWFGIVGALLAFTGVALDLPRCDQAFEDRRRREQMSPLAERIERLAENPVACWATLLGCLLTIVGIIAFVFRSLL
jgi:hypothetical protein